MKEYCIGIDTGGTFTDVVVLETSTHEVVIQAKERTTHHDLSIGINRALERLFTNSHITSDSIIHLAVSTTLATNAIVEGRGARVALFVLGHTRHFKLPVVANIFLKGGHTITGDEDEPLDMEGIIDSLQGLKDEVDSYAVCGAMSIQNPTHELVTEKAISLIDPKPVFCSHRVSTHPGMYERSATACLNAKLKPLMADFLSSVEISMAKFGLHCPVTVVCGDCSGASLQETIERSAITMASGPAATAGFGASRNVNTALVVDIGGTTTDVCLIKDGKPVMSKDGCQIGQWRTHVDAVDMYTSGGGGDSHVNCQTADHITLGTKRVQPLAMTNDLPDPSACLKTRGDTYIALPGITSTQERREKDPVVHFLHSEGPAYPSQIAEATGVQGIVLEKRLERLAFEQQVILSGFTPTDALHALGKLDFGDSEAATSGARALAEQLDISMKVFCKTVLDVTSRTIENILLSYIARSIMSPEQATMLLNRRESELFSIDFSLNIPIIGIGAAAQHFLPDIAQRLKTTVSFPDHYQVGNAVGAALIGMQHKLGL